MKRQRVLWAAALFLSACSGRGCGAKTEPPAASPPVEASSAEDAEQDNGPGPTPDATATPDLALPLPDPGPPKPPGDAEAGDALDDGGGAPEDGGDGGPDCAGYSATLPMPDTPCEEEGLVRCSAKDASAVPSAGYQTHENCVLPYRVQCTDLGNGDLQWVADPCPTVPSDCTYDKKETASVCQESSRGAHCCAAYCLPESGTAGWGRLSNTWLEGIQWCHSDSINSAAVVTVTFLDVPNVVNPNVYDPPAPPPKCGSVCADCLYERIIEVCPSVFCNFGADGGHDMSMCGETLEGPATCAHNCAEVHQIILNRAKKP